MKRDKRNWKTDKRFVTRCGIILSAFMITGVISIFLFYYRGIFISIVTNREVCEKDEDIEVRVHVKNRYPFSVENMVVHNVLPEGMLSTEEGDNTFYIEKLDSGQEVELLFYAVAAEKIEKGIVLDDEQTLRDAQYRWERDVRHVKAEHDRKNVKGYAEIEHSIQVDAQEGTIKSQVAYGEVENIIFRVIYEDYDGRVLEMQNIHYGAGSVPPAAPRREGYTFTGWDNDFDGIETDKIIQAIYERNEYKVTFQDYDEAMLSEHKVYHGEDAELPEEPKRAGHTFKGWDGEYTNITGARTLTALYDINTYKVVFKAWDGTVLSEQEVAYQGQADAPKGPDRSGWEFTGWDQSFSQVEKDMEIKACYEQIQMNTNPQSGSSNSGGSAGTQKNSGQSAGKSGSGNSNAGTDSSGTNVSGDFNQGDARKVLELMNAERQAAGLKPLQWDSSLEGHAKTRAWELQFSASHTRPDGTNCFALSRSIMAENIAGGQKTAERVYQEWYDSSGHRVNMMSASFSHVGIAKITVPGSQWTYYWVQLFR